MTRKFFGTDGIRGLTNTEPMTAETALRVGQAAGAHFLRGDHRHRVVIGKDTRLSGYMLETALAAGICAMGGSRSAYFCSTRRRSACDAMIKPAQAAMERETS